jgi:hypothetical protein
VYGKWVIVGNYAEWRVGFLNYVYEKGEKLTVSLRIITEIHLTN